MRQVYHAYIIVAVAVIAFCGGFTFAVNHVFYDYLHNIDRDGSRGRAMTKASRKAAEREDHYAELFGEDFRSIWSGEVVRVHDGDTITAYKHGDRRNERIRLWGIDSPEKGQEYGEEAKKCLESLVSGKRVDVVEIGDRDKYGRIVAIIEIDGVSVNATLIEAGYAWVYPKYCTGALRDEWVGLEGEALASRRGLWAGDGAIEPWEWRKKKHP